MTADGSLTSVQRIRDMFAEVVVAKNAELIGHYYAADFELFSNGMVQSYESFVTEHRKVYATDVQYQIEYDESAWCDAADRVAGRLWITTSRPDEPATRIEVVFIAAMRAGLITRLGETTWPNWSDLTEFANYRTDE